MTTCVTIKMNITSFHFAVDHPETLENCWKSRYTFGIKICIVIAICMNYLFVWFSSNLLTDRTNCFKCVSMAVDQEHPCTKIAVQNGL